MLIRVRNLFFSSLILLTTLLCMSVQQVVAAKRIVHSDFNLAFTPGHKFESSKGDTYTTEVFDAGTINIVSGKVCAFDSAVSWDDAHPFIQKVKPGKYPLKISRVTIRMKGFEDKKNMLGHKDQRNACAKVVFKKGKAVRWELAKSWDPGRKSISEYYNVDAGTACIADFRTLMKSRSQERRINDYFPKQHTPFYSVDLIKAKGTKLLIFDTGYGDGSYASYWGFDNAGNRIELVTDFRILLESFRKTLVINNIVKYRGKVIDHPELKKHNFKLKVLKAWPKQLRAVDVKRLLATRAKLFIHVEPRGECQLTLINGNQKIDSKRRYSPRLKGSAIEYFKVTGPIRPDAKLAIEYTSAIKPLQ